MKKVLVFLAIFAAGLAVAKKVFGSNTIGVIGGADGPTSIFMSKGIENLPKLRIHKREQ